MKFGPFRYQLVRYFFSGGIAAVTDLGLLYLLTDRLEVWYLWSAILAFSVAVVVSFTLQKFWTFEDHTSPQPHRQFALYLFVAVSNLVLNTLLMYLLVDSLKLNYIFAQVIVAGLIAVGSFFIYRRFIFQTT